MELEIADEDQPIMYVRSLDLYCFDYNETSSRYRVGESFIHLPHSRALKRLEKDKTDLDEELSQVSSKVEGCEKEMKELKVILYAKFGKAINLDE